VSHTSSTLTRNPKPSDLNFEHHAKCNTSHCNTLQHTATHCNTLQHTALNITQQYVKSSCISSVIHHTATHCNTLQHTASHCITLQHTATHCNTQPSTSRNNMQSRFAIYITPAPKICRLDSSKTNSTKNKSQKHCRLYSNIHLRTLVCIFDIRTSHGQNLISHSMK